MTASIHDSDILVRTPKVGNPKSSLIPLETMDNIVNVTH